jgi:Zn-dependent protease with chaperone function
LGEDRQSFVGYALHPDFGEEPIAGRIFFDRQRLLFEAQEAKIEMPLPGLELWKGDAKDGRIFFSHPNRADWTVYTFDERVLRLSQLLQFTDTRNQIEGIENQGELRRRLIITGAVLAVVVLVTILLTVLSGVMVRSLVARIPPEFEQAVGDEGLEELKQNTTFVEDPVLLARLDRTMAPLLKVVPSNGVCFKSYIIDDPVPNAFALPGGHVMVTTGLLKLASRPEEVAAAVAHELAHVTQKHSFRQAISSAGPFLLFRMFFGGRGVSGLIGRGSELLVSQSFSQDYELEADAVGWDYLVSAHIDPRSLSELLKKLNSTESEEQASEIRAFSSHPATEKRLNRLQAKWNRLKDKSSFIELPRE